MPKEQNSIVFFVRSLCLALLICLPVGCGSKDAPQQAGDDSEQQSALKQNAENLKTTSVAASKTIGSTSPASQANKELGADASPKVVCQRFMDELQSNNRIAAENLLTRRALRITGKADLELQPMGGPTSQYNIGEVRYATTQQKLAQVDCSIVDKIDGQEYRTDLTWLVRKQDVGWRISGVMLEIEPGQTRDLLSFENYSDVTRLQALAGEEVIDEPEATRQADASTSITK